MGGSEHVAALAALEARVVEVETRLAFQDDTIATLNAVVLERGAEVEVLSRQLERALADLERLRTLLYPEPGNEPPPPHY